MTNLQHWLEKDLWTELECRYLLTGLTPIYDNKLPFLTNNFVYTEEQRDRFEKNIKKILKGIALKKLIEVRYVSVYGDNSILKQGGGFCPNYTDVWKITRFFEKKNVIKWAILEAGLEVPPEIFEYYEKMQVEMLGNKKTDDQAKPTNTQQQREQVLIELLNELKAKQPDLILQSLPYNRADMLKMLADKSELFEGLSDSQFDKFFKAQKLCKLRRGRPIK